MVSQKPTDLVVQGKRFMKVNPAPPSNSAAADIWKLEEDMTLDQPLVLAVVFHIGAT
jgi:hypothetical protein